MALLLEPDEVAARVQLYTALQSALDDVVAAQKMPEQVPPGFHATWSEPFDFAASLLVDTVCARAWKSLRESAIKVAAERLRKAEDAVRRFEAGEEV